MKALTVIQPYASRIASGEKRVEYRSWFTDFRGPLLIHAGKKCDRAACARVGLDPDRLPRGVLLCRVVLYACVPLADGGFAWKLRDVRAVPQRPLRGRQGLWNV